MWGQTLRMWSVLLLSAVLIGGLAMVEMIVSSGLMGAIYAEGIWSKTQKEGTLHLSRYLYESDAVDWEGVEQSFRTISYFTDARHAITGPVFAYDEARAGLIAGGSDPANAGTVARLLRYGRGLERIDAAIQAWVRGDALIVDLRSTADSIRALREAGRLDVVARARFSAHLHDLDHALAVEERIFSASLSSLAAWSQRVAWLSLFLLTTALLVGAFAYIWVVNCRRDAYEDRLRKNEERLRLALRGADLGLWDVHLTTGHCHYNERWAEMLGYTLDEVERTQSFFLQLVHPDDRGRLEEATEAHYRGDTPSFAVETRLRTKDGRWRWIYNQGEVVEYAADGTPLRVLGTHLDITERKRVEAARSEHARQLEEARDLAQAATRAKSEFLATMSHEIRTPLNGVIGMASLLAETPLTDEQRDFLHTLRISGETLLALISDILDLSKIEAGRVELESEPFELDTCIADATALLWPTAQGKGLHLAYAFAPDVPLYVRGDMARLRQILVNLLGNAVKFTHEGHVTLQVSRSADDPYGIVLAVEDTGIGIPADRRHRLFEAFSQVDSSTTRQYGGTGLGLAISSQLAHLMGGTLGVESTEGVGSTFTVTVPLPPVEGSGAMLWSDEAQRKAAGRRVVIVMHEPVARRNLAVQLGHFGMVVDALPDVESLLARQPIDTDDDGACADLVCLDETLVDHSTLDRLRSVWQECGAEPAVVLVTTRAATTSYDAHVKAVRLARPLRRPHIDRVLREVFGSADRPAEPLPADAKETPAPRERRVLVAEDNSVNQRVLTAMLLRLGYSVDLAADGAEAVEMATRVRYDIILMDVQMPHVDGLEATHRIRRVVPAERQPIIIALTANVLAGIREQCQEAGMDAFVPKPVQVERLRHVLATTERGPAPVQA